MNVIKESFKYCRKYTPAWIIVILLGVTTVLAQLLLPQVPQLIVDMIINPLLGEKVIINPNNVFIGFISGFADNDYWGKFGSVIIIFLILLLTIYCSHYIRWNISHAYGVKAEKDMKQAVFAKLITQNSVVMERYTSGDLMSIANSDPVVIKDFYCLYFPIIIDQVLALTLAIFFLSRISLLLMILPFILGIATIFVTVSYTRALRKRYNHIRECSISLNSCVQENINGVRIIRAFASEDIEIKKFRKRNDSFRDAFISQSKTVAKYQVIFGTMGQLVSIGSIIMGIVLASRGQITTGEFTTFLTYVFMINNPLINITNYMGAIQNSMIAGNRMFTFLNTNNVIVNIDNPKDIVGKPNLSMREVTVQLDDKEELKDINIDIPYGKKLGIMGKTGSGKSVLLKSLARFYETTRGETSINGINIKDLRVDDVRKQFSYVMQDVFLFSNTVDANIALYDIETPHETVVEAAKIAEADNFINKLVDGYDTIVGERGLGLSGGQKQRISIARALVKNAPILMFDDCTSALDLETERNILHSLNEKYSDRTLIISSHRATSVQACDEILYMEDGEIVERGSHGELMEAMGKYYDVFTSQEAKRKEAIA